MKRSLEIRGLQTSWIEKGNRRSKKPIIFFIHGFPDDAQIWKHQIEEFSKDHLVVAPFLRGIGSSEPSESENRYSWRSVLLDHLNILREVNPDGERSVFVVGHDMGSVYAWQLARALKDRLAGLVAMNGPAIEQMWDRIFNPYQWMKSWYVFPLQIPEVGQQVYRYGGKALLKRLGFPPDRKLPEDITQFSFHYRQLMRAFLSAPTQVTPIAAPILVLWSQSDPSLETPTESELKKLARHFTIRVLDQDHWFQWSDFERVNQLIREFEKKVLHSPHSRASGRLQERTTSVV